MANRIEKLLEKRVSFHITLCENNVGEIELKKKRVRKRG